MEACSPEIEASLLASLEASAAAVTPGERWPPWAGVALAKAMECRRAVVGHALQHVEGRLVCLVGETRGQRALQRGDAASVRGHCPSVVARAAAVARGAIAGASALLCSLEASSAVTLSSRDWMAAALLPDASVFTARSVT